jgi:hypothetical protein
LPVQKCSPAAARNGLLIKRGLIPSFPLRLKYNFMDATSSLFSMDFVSQIPNILLKGVEDQLKDIVQGFWSSLLSFLAAHWLILLIIFFILFSIALIKAAAGRWGTLGSLLYNSLYFLILFLMGVIWGPQIFVNDIFDAIRTILIYPLCYLIVGIILDKTGFRKKYDF